MFPAIIYNENMEEKYTKEHESKRESLIILDSIMLDPRNIGTYVESII